MGRWMLNHWTTRKSDYMWFLKLTSLSCDITKISCPFCDQTVYLKTFLLSFICLFKRIIFICRIIALQHCVGFYHMSMWISHRCPLPPKPPCHPPPHPTPLGYHRAQSLSSLHHAANFHWLFILHMVMYMFPCYSLNSSNPLFPLVCPQVCYLCLCLHCCPANRFITTIFLDSIYMC